MIFRNEETRIQVAVANYIKIQHPAVLFTIAPSGMKLPIYVAKMLKAMGYLKGTPDLLIFEPRGAYHGLVVELKKSDGQLTVEQKIVLRLLDARGYKTGVCHGYNEAIDFINAYLKIGGGKER